PIAVAGAPQRNTGPPGPTRGFAAAGMRGPVGPGGPPPTGARSIEGLEAHDARPAYASSWAARGNEHLPGEARVAPRTRPAPVGRWEVSGAPRNPRIAGPGPVRRRAAAVTGGPECRRPGGTGHRGPRGRGSPPGAHRPSRCAPPA